MYLHAKRRTGHTTHLLMVQESLFFAGDYAQKLEIWTVNHSIFITLCNLSSEFLSLQKLNLTFPCCQCVLAKNKIELASWNSDELIWLIAIVINFLAFKFIIIAATAEGWLTIHTKLPVLMGPLSWHLLHFLFSLLMWK